MNNSICIDGRDISTSCKPYIIAEMSANHCGDIEQALLIIEQAKIAGADAVKIQTYRPDTITIDSQKPDFMIDHGLWKGKSLYALYQSAFTPWEWHERLFQQAKKVGITLFSSPFDSTAIELLEKLDTPAYKIASFELIDLSLIEQVASTGKPVIMSTGLATKEEIAEAVETARSNGCKEIALLHCVSGYPAPSSDYNLETIKDMASSFDLVVGLSDHTLGNATAIAGVSLGAAIVEKHFTISRIKRGADQTFSIEPHELTRLCEDTNIAWQSIGSINYDRKSSEKENIKFRRSLYVVEDLVVGDRINDINVRSIRPGYGLHPRYLNDLQGAIVKRNVARGTAFSWDIVK